MTKREFETWIRETFHDSIDRSAPMDPGKVDDDGTAWDGLRFQEVEVEPDHLILEIIRHGNGRKIVTTSVVELADRLYDSSINAASTAITHTDLVKSAGYRNHPVIRRFVDRLKVSNKLDGR